jgi:hypothetical protein
MPESKSGALPLGYAPMISDLLARTLPLLPGFASERGISMWPLPTSPGRVLIADRNALSSLAAASSCIIGVRWLRGSSLVALVEIAELFLATFE